MSNVAKIVLKHLLTLLAATFIIFVLMQLIPDDPGRMTDAKPVIYLYPEETTDVTVKLALDGQLTTVYPAYDGGWRVTAQPDGTLTDETGRTYFEGVDTA